MSIYWINKISEVYHITQEKKLISSIISACVLEQVILHDNKNLYPQNHLL